MYSLNPNESLRFITINVLCGPYLSIRSNNVIYYCFPVTLFYVHDKRSLHPSNLTLISIKISFIQPMPFTFYTGKIRQGFKVILCELYDV